MITCINFSGDDFRTEFAHLEVRSRLPASVNMMALTATAPQSLQQKVVKRLGMVDPIVISTTPDKPNIIYVVVPCKSLEEAYLPIVEQVKVKRTELRRVLIFGQR